MTRMVAPPETVNVDVKPSLSDETLAVRVRQFLLSHAMPGRGHLEVFAEQGVVTLQGFVGSFYHKQLWLHGAQRVPGVAGVIDQLDVAPALSG